MIIIGPLTFVACSSLMKAISDCLRSWGPRHAIEQSEAVSTAIHPEVAENALRVDRAAADATALYRRPMAGA